MDSLITAAARALAAGDPLGALKRVALREDPPALALRGIAMAQLGDLERARMLIRRAARAFGPKEAVAQARCVVAEAEIALASRDLTGTMKSLAAARATLEAHGDLVNAAHARCIELRHLLLIGRLEEAGSKLDALDAAPLPPALRAVRELIATGIAMRHVHAGAARRALAQATLAARQAGIPALMTEVENAARSLDTPTARRIGQGQEHLVLLDDVEELMSSPALIVDACRHVVRERSATLSLAARPVLFSLSRVLAEAWPGDVSRDVLMTRVFRLKLADETHRARLRVEVGRLRALLRDIAEVKATPRGFLLQPCRAATVIVLAPPVEERHADVLALLADGESWSSSALALALDASQRSLQRALDALAATGKVQSFGRGRARRWMISPLPGFATSLLLPAAPPGS